MANSSSSEEENDWLQHSRKRGNGTKRHTRSKSKNCAEQQETKRICRERICKKNALQKIKLISVSDSTHLYPKRNALKAASKNDDSEEDIEFMELWDGTCNNDRLQSPPQSDDDLEVIEVWNDILKSPPQLNEDQQFVQARKNKRKQVLLPPDVYPKVMQARKISCKNGRLQIPPQPDEGPEKTEVTQKSDQDQETLLTHLTSYQYPLTLKIPLKSEAEDLEALQNPLQSDQGTGIIYDSFQDQQEGDEIMEQGTPFQGEMDPIKSEVEENEVAVITDPFEQVKMEMNETEPVYPVALITIKRQSEISGVECFNIHDIDMPAFQTSGKDKRYSKGRKETEEQRQKRLEKDRIRRQNKISNETPDQKRARLDRDNQTKRKRLTKESNEKRITRLSQMAAYQRELVANETVEQRAIRLSKKAAHQRKVLANESEIQRAVRLSQKAAHRLEVMAKESEEQRTIRLQHKQQYMSQKRQTETDEERLARYRKDRERRAKLNRQVEN